MVGETPTMEIKKNTVLSNMENQKVGRPFSDKRYRGFITGGSPCAKSYYFD
jgi:hypothetical protein